MENQNNPIQEPEVDLSDLAKEPPMTPPDAIPDADVPASEEPPVQRVCAKCGAVLNDDYAVCPSCGAPVTAAAPQPEEVTERICSKCGTALDEGQNFCPKCGQSVTSVSPAAKLAKNRKLPLIGIAAAVLVVIIAIVLILTRDTPVETVTLREKELTLAVGEHVSLVYTVAPDDATAPAVTWSTSNESKATVEDGTVYAVEEGTCTITVSSSNGKTDTCFVTIESAGPDLEAIFDEYCDSAWAFVAADGSYLSIDTNPDDIEDHTDFSAYLAISSVNSALGLPDALFEKMGQTRALDGRQTESYDDLTVSWTYHPDNGMEIMYEKK